MSHTLHTTCHACATRIESTQREASCHYPNPNPHPKPRIPVFAPLTICHRPPRTTTPPHTTHHAPKFDMSTPCAQFCVATCSCLMFSCPLLFFLPLLSFPVTPYYHHYYSPTLTSCIRFPSTELGHGTIPRQIWRIPTSVAPGVGGGEFPPVASSPCCHCSTYIHYSRPHYKHLLNAHSLLPVHYSLLYP